MNYYSRHIGDYLSAASHLSLLEHGVYVRLMDVYYSRGEGILEADAFRLVGARSEDEKQAVSQVLQEFFVLVDGVWINHRCEIELDKYEASQDSAEDRRESQRERKKRHNARRKELFAALREFDVVPAWDTTLEALNQSLRECQERAKDVQEQGKNVPGTHPERGENAPGTANPLPTTHLPNTTATNAGAGARELVIADPPWFEVEPDPLVAEVARLVLSLPPRNAQGEELLPEEPGIRSFVAFARKSAEPLGDHADDAIRELFGRIAENYAQDIRTQRPKRGNQKPWLVSLREWVTNEAPKWAKPPPGRDRGSSPPKSRYDRDLAAVSAALGIP